MEALALLTGYLVSATALRIANRRRTARVP